MNLRRFRTDAEVILQHITLTADTIKDEQALAFADLAQGLELIVSALNGILKPDKPKLHRAKLAFAPPIDLLQRDYNKDARRKTPKQQKLQKPKRTPSTEPYGTFGCWDYPNAQYTTPPTESDIPELCRQKLLRDPKSGLFSSHEKTREWFVTKGWITELNLNRAELLNPSC